MNPDLPPHLRRVRLRCGSVAARDVHVLLPRDLPMFDELGAEAGARPVKG